MHHLVCDLPRKGGSLRTGERWLDNSIVQFRHRHIRATSVESSPSPMDLEQASHPPNLGKLLGKWTGFNYLRRKYHAWRYRRSVLTAARSRKASVVARPSYDDSLDKISVISVNPAIDSDGNGARKEPTGATTFNLCCGQEGGIPMESPLTQSDLAFLQLVQAAPSRLMHYATGMAPCLKYTIQQTIGAGSFSKVKLAIDTSRDVRVAIKMIPLRDLSQSQRLRQTLYREVQILRRVKHPRVVEFLEALVMQDSACLVMNYAPGVELFQFVADRKRLPEACVKSILQQLMEAVSYLHQNEVIHRDLKLENIIVNTSVTGKINITLVDFGLARLGRRGEALSTRCGSEEYAAPEVILGDNYDGQLSDAWSVGVIMYACLVGSLPFNPDPQRPRALADKIISGSYLAPPPEYVSAEAAQVIAGLLTVDPKSRTSIPQLVKHSYFSVP